MFIHVLEKADEQLRLKWNSLRNNIGLPEIINEEVMSKALEFAQVELPESASKEKNTAIQGDHSSLEWVALTNVEPIWNDSRNE